VEICGSLVVHLLGTLVSGFVYLGPTAHPPSANSTPSNELEVTTETGNPPRVSCPAGSLPLIESPFFPRLAAHAVGRAAWATTKPWIRRGGADTRLGPCSYQGAKISPARSSG